MRGHLALVLSVAAATLTPVGSAWSAAGTQQEQAACRPDVRKFCASVGGGADEKYRDCLQSHFQELSQNCQLVLKSHSH